MKEITKEHLGFSEGMIVGQSMPKYNGGFREVDWKIVKEFIDENSSVIESVEVGLAEDWTHTSGEVWNSVDGFIDKNDTYVYGSSSWATPSMDVSFKDGTDKTFEVWKLGDDAHSYFEL